MSGDPLMNQALVTLGYSTWSPLVTVPGYPWLQYLVPLGYSTWLPLVTVPGAGTDPGSSGYRQAYQAWPTHEASVQI